MSSRIEKTDVQSSEYPDVDEVYIVMHNKKTGKYSCDMLTGVERTSIGFQMEIEFPEPVELYGGLMHYLPNGEVKKTTVQFTARGVRRGLSPDIEKFSVEEMRESLNGD